MDVLFVCTANICRSPMAAALFAHRATERGHNVRVRSAGFLPGESPASEPAVELLAARGLDISSHRSSLLADEAIESADLVLCMTREHVREVVLRDAAAWAKTFTLKELVRRGVGVGERGSAESLSGWLERVSEGRRRVELLGSSPSDDVADPYRQPVDSYERTLLELDTNIGRLLELIF